jgi:hypothetical protein
MMTTTTMTRAVLASLAALAAASASADVPKALAVLEVESAALPGHVGASAPVRFVLLETGQIYVGGTSEIAVGQLTSSEQKALEKRLGDLRKLPGIGGAVAFGSGKERVHLVVRKGRPLDMVVTGAFADAPGPLKPLAALLAELASFDHPSLKRWQPASYALRAREGKLPGGCRPWPFEEPLVGLEFTPRILPADKVQYWPTGAAPASVCAGDKSWIVTLRPLVPDETP